MSDTLSSQLHEKSHILQSHVSLLSGDVRQLAAILNLFPVSPFPPSSAEISSPVFTCSKPKGRGAGILLPVHQSFFSRVLI